MILDKAIVAGVAISDVPLNADIEYSYIVPAELVSKCVAGARVLVPFSKGNKNRKAIVLSVKQQEANKKLKKIINVIDENPILSDEMLELAKYMSKRYFCPLYECVNCILPYGANVNIKQVVLIDETLLQNNINNLSDDELRIIDLIRNNSQPDKEEIYTKANKQSVDSLLQKKLIYEKTIYKNVISDNISKLVKLNVDDVTLAQYIKASENKNPKHIEPLEFLKLSGEILEKDLMYMTGASKSIFNTLEKRGIIKRIDIEIYRNPYESFEASKNSSFVLNKSQMDASKGIYEGINKGYFVSLLYGVTGSGKTHVFFDLCDKMLNDKKQVIILLPEISLTTQMLTKFYSRYSNNVAVIHSALSNGEKYDQYKRIKNGDVSIVIGTRSAIFAPFKNLGLIIIDEEQEHTYKSDMSPKYHTRELAVFRAKYNNAGLVLASATPSFESYAKAKMGVYKLFVLADRYNNYPLPDVHIVDMREQLRNGNTGLFSTQLADALKNVFDNGEQAILFINRRGYNSHITCRSCGYVPTCEKCSISYTYHKTNNRLMCHYCGSSIKLPEVCPECNSSDIKHIGSGTQKAEDELESLFPDIRILRMDADTTTKKFSYDEMLNDFKNKKYDVLLGTQMVTKGLDFSNVTLVGILAADMSLYSDDYKAAEKTFSLITQVVGRAGRGDKRGQAFVQTYSPDNHILLLSLEQDFDKFFADQIPFRKIMSYPPYCDLCQLVFSSENESTARVCANQFADIMREYIKGQYSDMPIRVFGPGAAQILKVNNKYRYKILIKCKANLRFNQLIYDIMNKADMKKCAFSIDINPNNII